MKEGVKIITDRMLLEKSLRSKLVITRLQLILAVVLLFVSVAINVSMFNKVETMEPVVVVEEKIVEKELSLSDVVSKFNNIDAVEDIVYYTTPGKNIIGTDLKYTDYILDVNSGESIILISNKQDIFIVYVENNDTKSEMFQALGKEYYRGTNEYLFALTDVSKARVLRHDLK